MQVMLNSHLILLYEQSIKLFVFFLNSTLIIWLKVVLICEFSNIFKFTGSPFVNFGAPHLRKSVSL